MGKLLRVFWKISLFVTATSLMGCATKGKQFAKEDFPTWRKPASNEENCPGCTVNNNMILFPKTAGSEVLLAWNFKDASNIDYSRVLRDEFYTSNMDNSLFGKITNYLTNSEGQILIEIPDINPADPYGGIFTGAGLNPNHRSSQFGEDLTQNYVYFSLDSRFQTESFHFYKKIHNSEGVLSLAEIQGIGIQQIRQAYSNYLEKNLSKSSLYNKDKDSLAMSFEIEKTGLERCRSQEVNLCFSILANANVPKAYDGSFENSVRINIGLNVSQSNEAQISSVSYESYEQPKMRIIGHYIRGPKPRPAFPGQVRQ